MIHTNIVLASADSGTDQGTLQVSSSSRNMSPTAGAAGSTAAVGAGQHPLAAADIAVEPAAAMLPMRSTTTAASSSAQDSAGASYHGGTSLDNQWSSAHNDSSAVAAAVVTDAVYNSSYFGGHQVAAAAAAFGPQRPQRPLHDIVSSMQGNFHFLQESQIELDSTSFLSFHFDFTR